MAGTLLLHAAMGCCWSHLHACTQCENEATVCAESCCPHETADHSQDHQSHHTPSPCHSQCHGVCTYLPVQKTHLDAPDMAAPFDFAAPVIAAVDSQRNDLLSWEQGRLVAAGPPVRLHLLHQLILV